MTDTDIYSDFKQEALTITYDDMLIYDFDLEPWELSNILMHLETTGTNWSKEDLDIKGVKCYDEDGDSFDKGVLQINAKGYTREDFKILSTLWSQAELCACL